MVKRTALIIMTLLLLGSSGVFAGDVATFVNLGFSADGTYFMFAQYGVSQEKSLPFAEAFTIQVARNVFVSGGVVSFKGGVSALPGQDGSGALYSLFENIIPLRAKYRIQHLITGRPLFISQNGESKHGPVSFRDFETGYSYIVKLVQKEQVTGTGKEAQTSSAFHLQLSITDPAGKSYSRVVGNPDYFRKGVRGYSIRQVIISPDNRSIVFVMEKTEVDGDGDNVRYMVETFRLN